MPVNLTGTQSASSVNVGSIFLQLNLQNNIGSQIQTQANQVATQTQAQFSRVSGGISSMLGRAFAGISIAALVKFGKECIDVASDLQEVQNVVDTAFGDMAYMCEEFAETASKQFGISELAAKKMSSTFMSMSTGMGLSGETAAKMSINVAKLSADVASFYNISSDLASTKLKAIWTGETEGLKDLGIVMTQTNLQAYALSKGITKNISDMTQAEQTTLRYNYVMEQLSLAQGDFAKTSSSWSNSVKAMGENLKTAMGNIGNILIKVFTPVLNILSEVIEKFAELTEKASNAFNAVFGGDTDEAVNNITTTGEAMAEAVEDANSKVSAAALGLAGFDSLYTLGSSDSSESDNSVMAAFGDIEDYKSAEVQREGILDKFSNKLKAFYEHIKPYAESFYNTFINPIKNALEFCISYVSTKIEPIKETLKGLAESVAQIFTEKFTLAKNIFMDVWSSIQVFWEKFGKPIFTGIIDGVTSFAAVVEKFVNKIIVPAFSKLFSTIQKWWDEHGRSLFNNLLGLIGNLGTFITNLWNKVLMPLFSWLIDTFGPFVLDMWGGICDAVGLLGGIITDAFNIIVAFFSSVFSALNDLINKGIIQTCKDFVSTMGDIFSNLWEIIKTPINWIIEGINAVISGLNSLSVDVPEWVPGIGGQTWGFNIPEIPLLAKGGIVDQPTLNIAGEAGPEAITPIDKLEEMIAKVVASTMAAMRQETTSEQEQNINLTVNLGSKTIVNEIIKDINRQSRVNGKSVIVNV